MHSNPTPPQAGSPPQRQIAPHQTPPAQIISPSACSSAAPFPQAGLPATTTNRTSPNPSRANNIAFCLFKRRPLPPALPPLQGAFAARSWAVLPTAPPRPPLGSPPLSALPCAQLHHHHPSPGCAAPVHRPLQ